jgi:type VI secretion system protein ImpG
MNEALFPYYERELLFLRQLAHEFTRAYPTVAARLLLEANRSADPHVERLIQSSAFLAGRVQQRLNDDFPEVSDALLQVLYPHYLAPVPSYALLEFELDPLRAQIAQGFTLRKGVPVSTPPIDGVPCRYRTTLPLTLWPIRLTHASLQPPPFPPGVAAPPGAAAVLRLQFETAGQMRFHQLQLESLPLYLHSEAGWVPLLYELLFNHALSVNFRPVEVDQRIQPFTLSPGQCLGQAGFDAEEELVPYPPRAPLGYRLLTEYFTFPAKFFFLDLGGWRRVARGGYQNSVEVDIFFDRSHKQLEQGVERSTFRLGCTPVVNLFSHSIDNLEVQPLRSSYLLTPETAFPRAYEIYSVDQVFHRDPATNVTTTFPPFYSVDHDLSPERPTVHWYPVRAPSLDEGDRGTNVFLHFTNLGFDPDAPDKPYLTVQLTCTNRDLPSRLHELGDEIRFQLETAAPLQRINVLRAPTVPLRPAHRRGRVWRILSHLTLNHLSVQEGDEGLEALRDLFRLYDYADPEAGQAQLANVALQVADGIAGVKSRRVIGQLEEAGTALFCRGLETTIELDEEKFSATGAYLFASILDRFLGLYVSANSFSELIVRSRQRQDVFKHWPPRAGQLPTL